MPPQQNKTAQQIVADLLKRLGEITERMGSMGASMGELFRAFKTLQEMVVRATFSLVSLVGGLPRFVKGDLHYALAGHRKRGGSHTPPTGEAAAGGGTPSSSGGKSEYPGHEVLMQQAQERHAQRMKHKEEEKKVDEDYWGKKKKQMTEEKQLDTLLYRARKSSDAKTAADERDANRNIPQVAKKATPIDFAFGRKAVAARKAAIAAGVHPSLIPNYNPNDPHYRNWVEASHKLTAPEAASTAATPSAAAGAAAPAATVGPSGVPHPWSMRGLAGNTWSATKQAFAQNSFAAFGSKAVASHPAYQVASAALGAIQSSAQGVIRAFLGVSTAAQGLIQAASPDTFDTFTGSLKLLAAVLGASLIPFFLQLSEGIQAAAFAFHDWSDAQKAGLGGLIKWTVIVLGLVAAFTGLAVVISALITPIGLVIAGLATFSAFLIARSAYQDEKKQRAMAKEDKETVMDIEANAAKEGYPSSKAALEDHKKKALDAAKDSQAALDKLPDQSWLWNSAAKNLELQEEKERLEGKRDKNKRLANAIDEHMGNAKSSEGKLMGLAAAFSTFKGQAQYSDVAGAYKRTQLAALADDPLTQLIKRIQAENLKQMSDDLKDIKGYGEGISSWVKNMAAAFGAP